MILCINAYQIKPGYMGRLLRDLRKSGIEKAIAQLPGCLEFRFSVPIEEENLLYLTDMWQDEDSFEHHLQAAPTQVWAKLKDQYVEESQLKQYNV